MADGGAEGKASPPSTNGDSKALRRADPSKEFCFFITDALQLDAGVIERLDGLEARVPGRLSSERRGVGGTVYQGHKYPDNCLIFQHSLD